MSMRDILRVAVVCAWAGMVLSATNAGADEIDDILRTERMAAAEAQADLQVAEPSPVKTSTAIGPTKRPARSDSAELQRARNEIARLNRALADQEARHQLELQRSYYNMGCVYKAAKQFDRAESEFLKALSINPKDAGVHYNLGILYEEDLHQKAKAREHYAKFLELAPDDRDAALVKEWLSALSE